MADAQSSQPAGTAVEDRLAIGRGTRLLVLGPLGPPHVEDQVLALRERGFEVHVGGNALEGLEDERMGAAGVPVHDAPNVSRSSPRGMASTVRFVRGLAREVEPHVTQAHWLPGFGFAAAAAGLRPLALTAWGSDVYRAGRVQRLANRFALSRADLLLGDAADLLERCGGSDSLRREVIQWGVDLRLFVPADGDERSQLKRSLGLADGPLVLSPRSLMPIYNIPVIIEAFERIADRHPEAQLMIKHMGEGSVQTEVPEPEDPERVRFVGNVPYERMVDFYRAADIVVSVPSSDATPRSVWEAMGCGAACVVSDLPWVSEWIREGTHAAVVPPGDAGALAETLDELIGNPMLAAEIGASGRALVEREMDRELHMDALGRHLTSLRS